jgi:toxin ParE1/3/4
MPLLQYTEKAILDLDEIWFYIGSVKGSPANAKRFLSKIKETIELLTDFPLMGKERKELRVGLRSITHGNYIIFYSVPEEFVLIERVLEGHRDVERLFGEEE